MRWLPVIRRSHTKPIILFCGRLINKKGLNLLIDVISQIPLKYNFEVYIYGEGPMEDSLKQKIEELGLKDKVKLKGFLPYEKMTEAYNSADIFIFPSLRESGGSVLIEAMAHSLPIVALNMALSKILNEHNTGIFIDIHNSKDKIIKDFVDAVVKLISNKKLRESLGSNGYHYVNTECTWDNIMDFVYGELLK